MGQTWPASETGRTQCTQPTLLTIASFHFFCLIHLWLWLCTVKEFCLGPRLFVTRLMQSRKFKAQIREELRTVFLVPFPLNPSVLYDVSSHSWQHFLGLRCWRRQLIFLSSSWTARHSLGLRQGPQNVGWKGKAAGGESSIVHSCAVYRCRVIEGCDLCQKSANIDDVCKSMGEMSDCGCYQFNRRQFDG